MAADRTDEGDAATVLRHVLGETVTVIDVPGAPDGTCDILAVPANRRIAVEVTSIVDAGELGFSHAVTAANWESPGLADPWGVSLCPRDDREETPEVPTRLLADLEGRGVSRFGRTDLQRIHERRARIGATTSKAPIECSPN